MRFLSVLAFWSAVFLGAGCTTSRVVEDTRTPGIVIDQFGGITFNGKRIEADQVAPAVVSAKIPRTEKIRILVPEQRDYVLMRTITDSLRKVGYMTVFVTDKKVTAGLQPLPGGQN